MSGSLPAYLIYVGSADDPIRARTAREAARCLREHGGCVRYAMQHHNRERMPIERDHTALRQALAQLRKGGAR